MCKVSSFVRNLIASRKEAILNPKPSDVLSPEQQKEVAAFAKEQFAFLQTEKGFSRPLIKQSPHSLLIYRNASMGIGIELHFSFSGYYYDDIKVTIGKTGADGKFPKFPYISAGRMRSFWVLQSFLTRQLHMQDEQIPALDQLFRDLRGEGGAWDVGQWKQAISSCQLLLREHIDLILQQPSEVLFPTAIEFLPVGNEEFAQLSRDHFAFLQEYGFQPEPIVGYYGSHVWVNAERGIEVVQDIRERDISCSIIKLVDGKIPTYDDRDLKRAEFTRRRNSSEVISLYNLLARTLEITDPELDTLRNIYTLLSIRDYSDYDYTYASTVIGICASLVKRYIPQLMRASF